MHVGLYHLHPYPFLLIVYMNDLAIHINECSLFQKQMYNIVKEYEKDCLSIIQQNS
jgi:hypothetical protein